MNEQNILLLLPISTNVNETKTKLKKEKRKQQYIDGIKQILGFSKIKQFDIVLIDNTTTTIDKDIKEIMPFVSEYIAIEKNHQGQSNPGAGIIDVWDYLKHDISTYEWIIHFEPRQFMKDYRIFEKFLENPRNIFMYGDSKQNHFYTGLFTLKSKDLLDYINKVASKELTRKRVGLEYSMFNHLNHDDICIVNELGIRWHDRVKNKYIDL